MRIWNPLPAIAALAVASGCGDDATPARDTLDARDGQSDADDDGEGPDQDATDDTGTTEDGADAATDASTDTGSGNEDANADGEDAGADGSDGGNDASEPTGRTIFDDQYGPGVGFKDFGGATNAISVDSTEAHAGSASLKVLVPESGYTGGAFATESAEDLSDFDAVVFWAKASVPAALNVVGVGNDASTNTWQVEWGGVALTTEWKRYIVPLPEPAQLTAERGLFHFAEGAESAPYSIWFDDIALVDLDDSLVKNPAPAIATESITREVGATANINGASVTYEVDGGPQTLGVARGYFSYASSNTSVATVDAAGLVTAVAVGTAEITAKFGELDAAGKLTVTVADANAPSVAAPAPTADAASVVSLFSDAYDDVTVDTWSASWDMADLSDVSVAGNAVKKYSSLVFAGIEFTSATIDASAMTHFHIDVWSPDAAEFKVKLVDFGANGSYQGSPNDDSEHELTFSASSSPALETGKWVSLDIPLSAFTGLAARGHLAQMILVSSNATVYVDNVYFYAGAAAPTAPTTAAPTPARASGDVLNLFSEAYPVLPVGTWSASWDMADLADVSVAGNAVKHYSNLVFAGIEFTSPTIDASAMTHFHIDIWSPDASVFKVKLVDFGMNGVWQGSPNDDSEHELTFDSGTSPALQTGTWVSLDIPLSAFTGLASRAHLAQMILVSSNASVFVDNIYFYK